MLQSPWLWWNSVHFRASKLCRNRGLLWPIGGGGWTLPALTSETFPPKKPPPATHSVSCPSSTPSPSTPSTYPQSQSISQSVGQPVHLCGSLKVFWVSLSNNEHSIWSFFFQHETPAKCYTSIFSLNWSLLEQIGFLSINVVVQSGPCSYSNILSLTCHSRSGKMPHIHYRNKHWVKISTLF